MLLYRSIFSLGIMGSVFGRGLIFALFQKSGRLWVDSGKFQTWVKTVVNSSAQSFQIQKKVSSGPVAVRFNLVGAFQTCLSVISGTLTSREICTGFRNSRSNVQAMQTTGKAFLKVSWRSLRRCLSMLVFSWSAFLRIYMAATFSLAFLLNVFSLFSAFKNIAIKLKPRTT